MNISRRSFVAGAVGIVSGLGSVDLLPASNAAAASPAPIIFPPMRLRGYGTLAAEFQPLHAGRASLTRIRCESEAKALLTQAKYLSDLGLLTGVREDTFTVGRQLLPMRRTASGGAIACYSRGREVLILAAESVDQLAQIVEGYTPRSRKPADFQARTTVPMYLDRWDRYGLLIYYAPLTAPSGVPFPGDAYDYGADLDFVKENGAGLVLWANVNQLDTAEGTTNDLHWEWVQQNALKRGIPVHVNTNDNWPILWLSNRFRDETQLKMPQFLGGFYDVGWQSGARGAISWFSEAGEDALHGVQQSIVRRFAPDANIVGWLEPHGETAQLPQSLFTEYGLIADRSLCQYLKRRFGKLSTLSERWHGDPDHYKSWNDIHAPELAEFAGFGPDAIDLRGTWRVKYVPGADPSLDAPAPPEWYHPDFDDTGWDEFVAPGNDRMLSMPRTPLVYRRAKDVPPAWLAGQPEVTLYVWDLSDRPQYELIAYVNGIKASGQVRMAVRRRWVAFNVTKLVKPGANLLVIKAPQAAICYRVYLTTAPPKQYPDLGAHLNARWADYNAWTLWAREAQLRRGAEMIRQVDPDRSINFMSPGDDIGPVTGICKDYGGVFHDTGAMAGFWTDEYSLMMSGAGLPATAEPGNGAPNVAEFQKFWGRWITEGLNGVHYFQHLGDIIWNPEVLAEFKKNRRLYETIGKYHVPFAEVAVLYSTRNYRLTAFPWDPRHGDRWTPGGYYSTANAAGILLDYCPRDGISEEDLGSSLAQRYRVVIDTNTAFWNDRDLADVRGYVRAGGVFITNGETGRHSEIEPDRWPISDLAGYSVVNPQFAGAATVPAPGQQVFVGPAWAGSGNRGMSLKKASPDALNLLLWSDGSVAIGMRPLGKGWIVHAGVQWSDGNGAALLRRLVSHFGAPDRVPAAVAPAPGLHFRHFIGNTGLQDLWALFNESDAPITTDLTFLPGIHPASLSDIVTGKSVPIIRDAGDSVRRIKLAAHQTVMYVSPRSDVAASTLEWLKLQRGWWQGALKPPSRRLPSPAEQQHVSLDLTQSWAYRRVDGMNDDDVAALAAPDVNDTTWERRDLDIWLTPNDHHPKRIILRRRFTVPARWTAGPIYLSTGGSITGARTLLDGKPLLGGRTLWDGDNLDDAGGALKPGTAHVLALDIQGSSPPIGVRGPVWLSYVLEPAARQDLSGTWLAYSDALRAAGPTQLPGPVANAAFLSRTVVIDAIHRGRSVVVYVSSEGSGMDAILINGSRLTHTRRTSDHTYVWFNITPMVRFGQENTIELSLIKDARPTPINAVEIRYYDRGSFPTVSRYPQAQHRRNMPAVNGPPHSR